MAGRSDPGGPTGRTRSNPAGWRGDYTIMWVTLLLFAASIAGIALILEFVTGWLVWALVGGLLLFGWLVAVLLLVPRSAGQGSDLALDKKLSGNQEEQSPQDRGEQFEQD